MKIEKAVILAGGYGTRMFPATKIIHKELLPIVNIPAIQFAIDECVQSGINNICIVLGENKYSIINYLEYNTFSNLLFKNSSKIPTECTEKENINSLAQFSYIQQGSCRGTAQALIRCKSFTASEPFCVLFPDEIIFSRYPIMKQLIEAYEITSSPIIGCAKIPIEDCYKYGMIQYCQNEGRFYKIEKIIEKPTSNTPSLLASCGRYIFNSNIYDFINDITINNNEYCLPDAINRLAKNSTVYGYEFEGDRFDIGNKTDYVKTIIRYSLYDKEISDSIKKYLMETLNTENSF